MGKLAIGAGKVLSIMVAEGDAVERGSLLLVPEAIKMAHRITAPGADTVKGLRVAEGQRVANGVMLIMLEDKEG